MNDPIRFLDETSDADELERSVLGAGFEPPPSKLIEDRILAQILASAALVPALAVERALTVKAASTLKTTIALGVAKGFTIGIALYGAVTVAQKAVEHFSAQPAPARVELAPKAPPRENTPAEAIIPAPVSEPVTSSSAVVALRTAASAQTARATPSAALAPSSLPAIAAFGDAPVTSVEQRKSRLEAEARLLRDARAALRSGQLDVAFALLQSSPEGTSPLYQEREALMIELLVKSGRTSEAKQHAHTFLDRFPESPHAARVKQLAESP